MILRSAAPALPCAADCSVEVRIRDPRGARRHHLRSGVEASVVRDEDACDSNAQSLYITVGTIDTHLNRVRTKYANVGRPAPTKAALVARAIQDGLITPDEL